MACPNVILTIAILCASILPCLCVQPGFKLRLSKKGLDYANSVAVQSLGEELKTLKIPNQAGHDGHLDWTLTGIQNRGFVVPGSSLGYVPAQNSLHWVMTNLGVNVHADWRVKYKKGWFKASTSGSLDVEVKRVSLTVNIRLAVETDGRPQLTLTSCHASVGDVDIHFHGGTAWILNLFHSTIEHHIRDLMRDEICKVVTKSVNIDANNKLKQIKETVEVDNRFLIDYQLVASPTVHTNDLETEHKGEVFWKGDSKEAPMSPKPFPPLADESHMMYLWVSEYVANSFTFSAQGHKFLRYNLTEKDFPESKGSILNTTCRVLCVGKLIPQIGKRFPNAKLEARVTSLVMPRLAVTAKGMELAGDVEVALWAHLTNGSVFYVVTLDVKCSFSVIGSVVKDRLSGKIVDHAIKISVKKSAVGEINEQAVTLLVNAALNIGVIPNLNNLMAHGVELPTSDVLSLHNAQLTLLDGVVVIATDFTAKPFGSSQTLLKPAGSKNIQPQPDVLQRPKDLKFVSELKRRVNNSGKMTAV